MNRHEHRAAMARRRRGNKRALSITALSFALALKARQGQFSRNEARRRLKAECVRRYGKKHAIMMSPRLHSADEVATALAQAAGV